VTKKHRQGHREATAQLMKFLVGTVVFTTVHVCDTWLWSIVCWREISANCCRCSCVRSDI